MINLDTHQRAYLLELKHTLENRAKTLVPSILDSDVVGLDAMEDLIPIKRELELIQFLLRYNYD